MKKGQILVADRAAAQQNAEWERIIDQIKGLTIDQRFKLAENIRITAVAEVKSQQEKLQRQLSQLSSMLAEPITGIPAGQQANEDEAEESGTRGKILAALRKNPMTVSQLKQATRTEWVATPLSQLVQSRQVVNDGKRPATYSLRRQ